MNILGIHHIAIICSDYQRSKDFYVNMLGCKIICEVFRQESNSYKLDLQLPSGEMIELFSFPNPPVRVTQPEATGLRHLAFKVENIEEAIQYLRNNNISVEDIRIDEHSGKKYTFFTDPDGLPLELYQA
jgi:glyoxylase I family protein